MKKIHLSRKAENKFIVFAVTIMLLAFFLGNLIFLYHTTERKLMDDFDSVTHRITENISTDLNNLNYTMFSYFMNDTFQNMVSEIDTDTDRSLMGIYNYFELLLSSDSNLIKGVMFVPYSDGKYTMSNAVISGNAASLFYNINVILEMSEESEYSKGNLLFYDMPHIDGTPSGYVCLGRNILSTQNNNFYEKIGFGLIVVNKDALFKHIKYIDNHQGVYVSIYNKNQIIVSYGDYPSGNNLVSKSSSVDFLDWQIHSLWDKSEVFESMASSFSSLIILVLVFIVLFIFVYTILNKKRVKSLDYLFNSFSNLRDEQKLAVIDMTEDDDEVNKVIELYNTTVYNVNALNDKLIEEEHKLALSKIKAVESEIKSLFSQINKHFLINVLSSVRSLVNLKEYEKATECIENLSAFLRYSLTLENDSTIRGEIDSITHYLNIQRVRFPDISFEINCDDAVKNTLVPKVLLQPIVENCYTHGFKNKKGYIRVNCFKFDNKVVIKVINSNDSASSEMLEAMKEKFYQKSKGNDLDLNSESRRGIAINNIRERLDLLFGSDTAIDFEYDENETVVSIIFPFKE